MDEPKYKRVLLKISGEALAGDKHFGRHGGLHGHALHRTQRAGHAGRH